jgi:hypothetical protein
MFRAKYGIDYASTYNQGYSNQYATFSVDENKWSNYGGSDLLGGLTQYNQDHKTGD